MIWHFSIPIVSSQILQEVCVKQVYYNKTYNAQLTRPELKLSTSDQRVPCGVGDGNHRPLMHQPVNYPDVRIVWKHKFKLVS